jgi:superfamily II DNA or RNA helicase/ubiquinone/menaquinone biosynthesis C-methylase UbiE
MILRECQQNAIQCIDDRKSEYETNISMCTGAGKSMVIREVSKVPGRRILVFPWLDLMIQFYDGHKDAFVSCPTVRYFATEGTLTAVSRLSTEMSELDDSSYVLFTTYTSAPLVYAQLSQEREVDLILHDEAHRTERPEYKAAVSKVSAFIKRIVNLSATLPNSKEVHYRYSLLRGIRDGVVRDFHMELFLCVSKERNETALLFQIVEKLRSLHKEIKLLIYTAEANTENDDTSSVLTFMNKHSKALQDKGYWIEGIKADTKDRKKVLREFEGHREVSLLVSCKTLSEGIDLKNVNCMLPWDPSSSPIENIQRIGRALRLLKDTKGGFKKDQPASTVLIPVFLEEEKYQACGGNRDAINDVLSKEISEGEKGNFRPIVNVCTALKEELAEDDPELFNRLLNWPAEPKVAVNKDLVECVAKQCKKTSEEVLEQVVEALQGKVEEEQLEEIEEGEWSEELNGQVAQALAHTQGITLVVRDGQEADIFGKGETTVTVEKQADESYKIVKEKKEATKDKELAKKRIAQRMNINFSDDCQVMLGLDSIEGADATGGMVLTRLTTEVRFDEDWEKRRLEWVAMYEKLGRCPSGHSKNLDEKRAGNWQYTQRNNYRKKEKCMTSERIVILEGTPGWKWNEDDKWELQRQRWLSYYQKLGRGPNAESQVLDEKQAGNWQYVQRRGYRKRSPWMTKEKISILESTPGWRWEEEETWETKRKEWIQQYEKLGRQPSYASKDSKEKKAGAWQTIQRRNYKNKKGCLTSQRIEMLESTPGWKWEENDVWEPNRQNWIKQFQHLGRFPNKKSEDPEEKRAGAWQSTQRQDYRNEEKCMTSERIAILEATPGWKWIEKDTWEDDRQRWISQYIKNGRLPSQHSNDLEEKKAENWQLGQRRSYKKKAKCMTPERIQILESTPGWSWSNDEPPKTPASSNPQPRTRKSIQTKEGTGSGSKRQVSQLEEFHKRFKTMNAATYKSSISKEDFTAYHTVADSYDAKDPIERQPIHKIAALLSKYNKPSYTVVDLGCGKNRLRSLEQVSKMNWTSVDVHAVDETVSVADMSSLPYDDESFDFAILSRSLWARNHMDVLKETYRILKSGGRVIVCESFHRWMKGEENELVRDLQKTGFELVFQEGTSSNDEVLDVFQYIVGRRIS